MTEHLTFLLYKEIMFLYKLKWVKKEKSYFCLLFLNLKYFRTTKKKRSFFPFLSIKFCIFFVDFILLISLDKCITCSAQIHILKKIIHNILGSISQKFNNQHQMYFHMFHLISGNITYVINLSNDFTLCWRHNELYVFLLN